MTGSPQEQCEVQERGLCHSLRCRALHADEASPHKAHLARGHVPAHTPGQARHLGTDDFDDITNVEGHLFGSRALEVSYCRGQAKPCRKKAMWSELGPCGQPGQSLDSEGMAEVW